MLMIKKNKIKYKLFDLNFFYKTLFLEYPFQKKAFVGLNYLYGMFFMRKQNKECILCDYLIIGSNPILNILLAHKLSNSDKNICIWQSEDIDWWNYNLALKTDVVNAKIKSFFKTINGNLIENMLFLLNIIKNKENVFWLDNINNKIDKYSSSKEDGLWTFYVESGSQDNFNTVHAKSRVDAFNEIALKMTPSKKDKDIVFRKNEKTYLLAKEIYLTSLPKNLFNIEENMRDLYISNKYELINKENVFGSADKIASTGEYFAVQPMADIDKILNTLK